MKTLYIINNDIYRELNYLLVLVWTFSNQGHRQGFSNEHISHVLFKKDTFRSKTKAN